jgi:hypothetical protein
MRAARHGADDQGLGQARPIAAGGGLVPLVLAGMLLAACGGVTSPGGSSATGSAPGASAGAGVPTVDASLAASPTAASLPEGVLASIPLLTGTFGGNGPSGAAIGFGSVWVETHRATTLFRVDPETDQVVAQIDVGQESCGEPAIGFGRVWLGECASSTKTVVVDPTTNEVVGSFEALGGSIAFTSDAVWIPDTSGKLLKVDPATYRTLATYDPFPSGFTSRVLSADGWIWAVDEDLDGNWGGSIAKIDPAKGSIVSRLTVPEPGGPAVVSADLGYIWVKGISNGRLTRIDPKTDAIKTFDLAGFKGLSQLYDIWPATGLGSVWVRLSDDVVTRVDPKTGAVTGTYPADARGGGGWPTVGFGSLWIPNFGSGTLWRDRVAP